MTDFINFDVQITNHDDKYQKYQAIFYFASFSGYTNNDKCEFIVDIVRNDSSETTTKIDFELQKPSNWSERLCVLLRWFHESDGSKGYCNIGMTHYSMEEREKEFSMENNIINFTIKASGDFLENILLIIITIKN